MCKVHKFATYLRVYHVVGGSRYIPGGGGGEASTQSAADPFTGSTRYVPGGASSSSSGLLRCHKFGGHSGDSQQPSLPHVDKSLYYRQHWLSIGEVVQAAPISATKLKKN